jgi:microcystin-dependent protein
VTTPYISEIRLMAFPFAPKGWALCNGQILPISQYQALFSLIGVTYGGDGVRNFALPNLQGRVPIHMGPGYTLGQVGGESNHTLVVSEIAPHQHTLAGQNSISQTTAGMAVPDPTHYLANGQVQKDASTYVAANYYGTGAPNRTFSAQAIAGGGSGQGHPNEQPYLILNFCMALAGVYPSRS